MHFAAGVQPLRGLDNLGDDDDGSDINATNIALTVGITTVIQACVVLAIVVIITIRRVRRRRAMEALRRGKQRIFITEILKRSCNRC